MGHQLVEGLVSRGRAGVEPLPLELQVHQALRGQQAVEELGHLVGVVALQGGRAPRLGAPPPLPRGGS